MGFIQYEPGESVEYPSTMIGKADKKLTIEDYWTRRYPSGQLFSRYLYSGLREAWIKEMRAYQAESYDNVVLVTGSEGSGKSTAAISIAKEYDPDFTMDQVAYTLDDVLKIILAAKKGAAIILDEAEELVDKQQHNTYENQTMKKVLILGRSLQFLFLILIPEDQIVMPYILRRCRYHAHVEELAWTKDDTKHRGYFRLSKYERYENKTKEISIGYSRYDMLARPIEKEYISKKEGSFYDFIEARRQENMIKQEKKLGRRGPGRPPEDPDRIHRWLEQFEAGTPAGQIAENEGVSIHTIYGGLSRARKARRAAEEE